VENIPDGDKQDPTIDQLPTTLPPQGAACPHAVPELPLQLAVVIQTAPTPSANHRLILRSSPLVGFCKETVGEPA
jgi:hypothetical protein